MPLELDQVSFRYDATRSLIDDVSLIVAEGESVAILGPSGSGKSTLLAIMGLLIAPLSGAVILDGTKPGSSRRATALMRSSFFAWVFQTSNMLPRRAVLDNVAIGLIAGGARRSDAEGVSLEALERVGLGSMRDRPITDLSGGEVQRVGIARALALSPRVVLADEPTGQLDAANSSVVVESLLSATNRRASVVIATHDGVVARMCDRRVRLVDGRVQDV